MTPVRKLTHKGKYWHWINEQQKAINRLKYLIAATPILAYFDPTLRLALGVSIELERC